MAAHDVTCTRRPVLVLSLALGVFSVGCAGQIQTRPEAVVTGADHHIHLQGPEITRIVGAALRAEGGLPQDTPSISPPTADDAVEALDSAGLRCGLVLSGAYLWGSPHLRTPTLTSILDSLGVEIGDERPKMRSENRYVIEQVAYHPERLVGACSANPLKDYAFASFAVRILALALR